MQADDATVRLFMLNSLQFWRAVVQIGELKTRVQAFRNRSEILNRIFSFDVEIVTVAAIQWLLLPLASAVFHGAPKIARKN
jgi:hypothetical protein